MEVTTMHRKQARQFDYEELVKQIAADPDVAAFGIQSGAIGHPLKSI